MINRLIIQERIDFLQSQIQSLDHYLPETYQFLMAELDLQQREMMEHKIQYFHCNQTNERLDKDFHPQDTEQT